MKINCNIELSLPLEEMTVVLEGLYLIKEDNVDFDVANELRERIRSYLKSLSDL